LLIRARFIRIGFKRGEARQRTGRRGTVATLKAGGETAYFLFLKRKSAHFVVLIEDFGKLFEKIQSSVIQGYTYIGCAIPSSYNHDCVTRLRKAEGVPVQISPRKMNRILKRGRRLHNRIVREINYIVSEYATPVSEEVNIERLIKKRAAPKTASKKT